ncbi:MAG: type II toxin-antitoxin system YafQ family toxin [Porphyromonas sp.]|nr:MAG: type II toxin-antitoxin system YafQ family toxin [Porphyromonas sp.]RKW46987.1 MAG: type II toxin-antitoxin system YafQ family toxin [Porphyromonas sp.]
MTRRIEFTSKFKKDLKRLRNNEAKLSKVANVIELLAQGEDIPASMKPHKLIGNYAGHLELHIEGDLLLIWLEKKELGDMTIYLVRLGSHSELFGK